MSESERRCQNCGALVSAGAGWCGQCFTSFAEPEPESEPEPERAASDEGAPTSGPTWPCGACGHANPIELDVCADCGSSFAATMRRSEPRAEVAPNDAMVASLMCPGLGHARMGRTADGVARGSFVFVLLGMALLLLLSGVRGGVPSLMFWLFVALAIAVYVGTAVEARQIADGGEPVASARTVLWTAAIVILVSIMLLSFALISGAKR